MEPNDGDGAARRAEARAAFDALKRDALARTDLGELIASFGVELKRKGKELVALCPFHTEKTGSFTVTPVTQLYYCFGCHKGGDAIQFLMEHQGLRFIDAVIELAERAGLDTKNRSAPRDDTGQIRSLVESAASLYHREILKHPEVVAYLEDRGLDLAAIERYRIGFAGENGNLLRNTVKAADSAWLASGVFKVREGGGRPYPAMRTRIVFPITDSRGRAIGLGGRAWQADQQPKYLNTGETAIYTKGAVLFGLPQARPAPQLSLVEGYFDAIAMTEAGFPAVSSCGTAVTEEQLREALRATECLVIGLDPDAAGRAATVRAVLAAIPLIRGSKRLRVAAWPGGRDVDETLLLAGGREQIAASLAASVPATTFLFGEILPSGDRAPLEERAAAVEQIDKLLAAMPASALREQLEAKRRELRGQRPEPPRQLPARRQNVQEPKTQAQLFAAGLLVSVEARMAWWLDPEALPEFARPVVRHLARRAGTAASIIADAPEDLARSLRGLVGAVPGDIDLDRVEGAYWRAVLEHLSQLSAFSSDEGVWDRITEAQDRIAELDAAG